MQKIGRSSLLSCEGVLDVLEYQQSIDEHIEAEKQYDETFAHQPVYTPEAIAQRDEVRDRWERARERVRQTEDENSRRWDVC